MKKDVTNDETLRGAVSKQRAVDIRMGEPTGEKLQYHIMKKIVIMRATRRTETSKYPEEKKEKSIS